MRYTIHSSVQLLHVRQTERKMCLLNPGGVEKGTVLQKVSFCHISCFLRIKGIYLSPQRQNSFLRQCTRSGRLVRIFQFYSPRDYTTWTEIRKPGNCLGAFRPRNVHLSSVFQVNTCHLFIDKINEPPN